MNECVNGSIANCRLHPGLEGTKISTENRGRSTGSDSSNHNPAGRFQGDLK